VGPLRVLLSLLVAYNLSERKSLGATPNPPSKQLPLRFISLHKMLLRSFSRSTFKGFLGCAKSAGGGGGEIDNGSFYQLSLKSLRQLLPCKATG